MPLYQVLEETGLILLEGVAKKVMAATEAVMEGQIWVLTLVQKWVQLNKKDSVENQLLNYWILSKGKLN